MAEPRSQPEALPASRKATPAQEVREILPPLAEVARSLAQALAVAEVARRVSTSAVELSRAHGAYVEQIVSPDGEVEIIAAAGEGVPECGLRIAYPGSLTEEILESGLPSVIAEVGRVGRSAAPYLQKSCARCSGLVVPLVSEGEVLGTLVLLRDAEQPRFEPKEVTEARMLGDLAAVSLRRALVLERERKARAQAEAAVQARDRVLRVVSHDLKNPLHTIRMAVELLLELPLGEAEREKHLHIVLNAGERMERLVADLLDVARLDGGHALVISPAPTPVRPLVDALVAELEPQATEKRQSLEAPLADSLPEVLADPDRVLQVLTNLVGNAIKFTPQNGRIRLSAEPDGTAMRFRVSDSGPGISQEDLPHLFQPFWQAERTASLGSGLGLAISRAIVEAHGGEIGVESTGPEGTTFGFTLPLARRSTTR